MVEILARTLPQGEYAREMDKNIRKFCKRNRDEQRCFCRHFIRGMF